MTECSTGEGGRNDVDGDVDGVDVDGDAVYAERCEERKVGRLVAVSGLTFL